jgi:single-strand DNA-binding protein
MSNDLNYCSFIGRLGADPVRRFMPNGDPVTSFRIAVGWKGKDKEGAEWVSIEAFSKLAEICHEYLRKGSQVFVSGRMKTDEYEKDGIKRYSTKIVADRMQMLGSKGDPQPRQDSGQPDEPSGQPASAPKAADLDDDSIPF